jgi:lysophospholipase L1-like esterase
VDVWADQTGGAKDAQDNSMNYRVLCFGASITYGAWDEEGGWADRIKRDLHALTVAKQKASKYQFFNLGVGGNTSTDLVERFEAETTARVGEGWNLAFIISIGINDTRIMVGESKPQVPLEVYRRNLETVVAIAKHYSQKILFVGLTPVKDEEVGFKTYMYRQQIVKEYSQAMREIAQQHHLPIVDVYDELLQEPDRQSWYVDRLHPDERGHKWLYERIKPEVLKMLQ